MSRTIMKLGDTIPIAGVRFAGRNWKVSPKCTRPGRRRCPLINIIAEGDATAACGPSPGIHSSHIAPFRSHFRLRTSGHGPIIIIMMRAVHAVGRLRRLKRLSASVAALCFLCPAIIALQCGLIRELRLLPFASTFLASAVLPTLIPWLLIRRGGQFSYLVVAYQLMSALAANIYYVFVLIHGYDSPLIFFMFPVSVQWLFLFAALVVVEGIRRHGFSRLG